MKNIFGVLLSIAMVGNVIGQPKVQGLDETQVRSISLSTGVQLEYAERGNLSGTPIIFLHGITDSWHSFEKVLPLLPQNFHAFALSQRGHGDSGRPPVGYHPKDFAADVAAFIKQKNLKQVVVVGHSMGSAVAQQFVLDYPQLVKGMILIGADASFKDNPGMPEFYDEVSKIGEKISREFMEAFQKATLAVDIDPNYFETIVNEGMKVPGPVFIAAMRGLMDMDLTASLKNIEVPTLILWGEKDMFCLSADQELLTRNIRNAKLLAYAETGHALHWEKPQRFVQDLSAFVMAIE
jgi:non-heme chloroperoxidase